jgi:hypothetical protein
VNLKGQGEQFWENNYNYREYYYVDTSTLVAYMQEIVWELRQFPNTTRNEELKVKTSSIAFQQTQIQIML